MKKQAWASLGLLIVLLLGCGGCGKLDTSGSDQSLTLTSADMSMSALTSFQLINSQIITPKCVSCHNSQTASAGIQLDSYDAIMTQVNAGDPDHSPLYEVLDAGLMPKNADPLATDELQAIYNWIQQGAENN